MILPLKTCGYILLFMWAIAPAIAQNGASPRTVCTSTCSSDPGATEITLSLRNDAPDDACSLHPDAHCCHIGLRVRVGDGVGERIIARKAIRRGVGEAAIGVDHHRSALGTGAAV